MNIHPSPITRVENKENNQHPYSWLLSGKSEWKSQTKLSIMNTKLWEKVEKIKDSELRHEKIKGNGRRNF